MDVSEPAKETKTAEELAAMIREDLSKVDGCPKAGVNVTVYGLAWNAMLMFGAAAGPFWKPTPFVRAVLPSTYADLKGPKGEGVG